MRLSYRIEQPGGAFQPPHAYTSRAAAVVDLRRLLHVNRVHLAGPVHATESYRDNETGDYRERPIVIWYAYRSQGDLHRDYEGAYAPRIVGRQVRP